MPNMETHKLCNFKSRMEKHCRRECGECCRHDNLKCCCCGGKASRICEAMSMGNLCESYLCNKCEHVGDIHKKKIEVVRNINIQISFICDNNTYRSGKLNRVIENIIQNAIETHCENACVNSIEVSNV